jgi:hypothetical protein
MSWKVTKVEQLYEGCTRVTCIYTGKAKMGKKALIRRFNAWKRKLAKK